MNGAVWIAWSIYIIAFLFPIEGGVIKNMDEFTIGNIVYYLSRDEVMRHQIGKACEERGLAELFIQSNQEFFLIRTWISDNSSLDDVNIWIATNLTGSIHHEWWSNQEVIAEDAWMFLADETRGRVEPNGYGNFCEDTECCVYFSKDWGYISESVDARHYLMDNVCDQTMRFLCVEAIPDETTTITSTTTSTTPTTTSTTTTTTEPTTTPTTPTTTSTTPEITSPTTTKSTTPEQITDSSTITTPTTTTPPSPSPSPTSCTTINTNTNNTSSSACPCTCKTDVNLNPSPTELQTMVEEIHKELTVPKTALSSMRNKKECASDDRTSSISMGVLAVSLSVTPLIFMLLLDLNRLLQFVCSKVGK